MDFTDTVPNVHRNLRIQTEFFRPQTAHTNASYCTDWLRQLTPDTSSRFSSHIESNGPTWLDLNLFKHCKLYRLKPNCRGGIILLKRFYTELISPGSALGGTIDQSITGVFAFGTTKLSSPRDPLERQQAFLTRLNQSSQLKHLMQEQSEFHRVRLLLEQLDKLAGATDILSIPPELLGQLIGLSPKRIVSVRSALFRKPLQASIPR